MLTEPELLVRARDWSEELYGIVPAEALNASVTRAFEDHNSAFPLNAYDLKIAYEQLKLEQVATDDARTFTTDERVEQCTNRAHHLQDRFGEIKFFIPGVTEDEVIVPCGLCRKEDFMLAKAQILGG